MARIGESLKLDFKDFEKGLKELFEKSTPEAVEKGLFAAGNELLSDSIRVSPMAPKDVGDLWRSAQTSDVEETAHKFSMEAGFNIVYARKWHEVPLSTKINWTTDKGASSPGPKFLQSKMMLYRGKYMRILGDYLYKMLHGGK